LHGLDIAEEESRKILVVIGVILFHKLGDKFWYEYS